MIDITKAEAEWLRSHGRGHDVHMSSKTHKGRAKKYFATESPKTMKIINELRDNIIYTRE